MNTSDKSLDDGPRIVTKALSSIAYIVLGHFMGSRVEEDLEEEDECEKCSKRSTRKGLFLILQVGYHPIEG